ncbi:MAG: glycosyltransferase family 4 protein [Candidatus Nanopelagicales bacterium]
MTRVAHVIAEYSRHEAMGRTVAETARLVAGEHHLITARVHETDPVFASQTELSGAVADFPLGRGPELRANLERIAPDLVHVHGGALAPLLLGRRALGARPNVLTCYAWPTLPNPRTIQRAGWGAARASNVLVPRVLATTLLPPAALARAIRANGTAAVLSPDPRVISRLGRRGIEVTPLGSGVPHDERRATWNADAPVIVFAGRAESVRGIDTLLTAFELVLESLPAARLRLLLIARPELAALRERVAASPAADSVEIRTEPVGDLSAELAKAQLGVWPFKFDYTTSPPAMAAAEALSVGLPVVGTQVACIRAVIRSGENGLLVPPMDARRLAAAIWEVLGDRALWSRFAAAGPAGSPAMTWEATAATTAAAYQRGRR